VGAICEHLQAITEGQIENLLINVPPGCSKSLLTCVMWFCWEWVVKPETRFLYASYHQDLTTRDSVKCRALLNSKWYRSRWGYKFDFTDDQNLKLYYENTKGGYRLATTPGGRGTGEHPDRIVADDPHNVKQAESEQERKSIIDWWDLTISSRGLSRGCRRAIIMQRLNELDLSGHVLNNFADEWVHLCLPMRYETGRMKTTVLGFNDPRTKEGELLTPLFDEVKVRKLENRLGEYGTAGQLQQRPAPLEGGMFKRAWFEIVEGVSSIQFDSLVRAWDLAATEGDGDYTVGILLGRKKDDFWILDMVRGQWGSGKRDDNIDSIANSDDQLYGKKVEIWFPQDPAQAGKSQAELLAKHLSSAGYRAKYEVMSGDKEVRAQPMASRAWAGERGNYRIKLVKALWNQYFLNELCTFPNAAHDDIVDAVSLGFNKIAKDKRKLVGA
jgi:predicted phage terminase large subunit-like protein